MMDSLARRIPVDRRPGAWGFVCGQIAALESELSPRAFFDGLLRANGPAELRQAFGKSAYRPLFNSDEAVKNAGPVLDAHFAAARGEILSRSPEHPIKDYFELGARYRSFRTLFNQRGARAGSDADELEALFRDLARQPVYAEALVEHRALVFRKESPQAAGALERSLYLDSVACTLMGLISEATPEPLAKRFLADRAVLAAWSAVMRARWNGAPADGIRKWFVFGQDRSLASSLLAGENHPALAVSPFLSAETGRTLSGLEPSRVRADIDAVSADALRDTVSACRTVTSGAERVLSYLVSLEVEAVNLQLCVAAVVNEMERGPVAERLRREYA